MSKVVLRRMTRSPHGLNGCLHEIDQEVLTDKGKRIPFPPGVTDFMGQQLYARIVTPCLHTYPFEEYCEEIDRSMIREHLKTVAKVMEWVKGPGYLVGAPT